MSPTAKSKSLGQSPTQRRRDEPVYEDDAEQALKEIVAGRGKLAGQYPHAAKATRKKRTKSPPQND